MITTSNVTRAAVILMSLGLVAGSTQFASAKPFHPRRAEVNARLTVQNYRINQAYKHGKISLAKAGHLHALDNKIRKQEHFDASLDKGHITRSEQKSLNQLENKVGGKI